MKGPSLTIGSQSQPAHLDTFLAGLDKNAKLRAKKDGDGNTILYASTKRSSLFSRVTGHAAKKREAARNVIDNTFRQMEARAMEGAVNNNMREPTKNAFADLRNFLTNNGKTGLRVRQVKLGLEVGKAAIDSAKARRPEKTSYPLDKLGDLQAPCDAAAGHLRDGDREGAMKSLGDAIGGAIRNNFSDKEKDAFAFSAGIGLRQKVSAALESLLGDEFDKLLPPGDDRDSFLRGVAFQAAGQVLDNRQIDENTIRIGGETYTKFTDEKRPDGKIGEGGFADVFVYQRQKDDGSIEKIAVKFSKPAYDESAQDEQLAEFGHEVLVHQAAVEGGADNIIGLKGGLRTSDGRVAIALEFAPNGDLHGAIGKLKDAVDAQQISPQAAAAVRLTLLQDMAKGIASLEQRGILNGDAKPPNVLIGVNGAAKIADLGTAQVDSTYVLKNSNNVDNPLWLAPEVLVAQRKVIETEGLKSWDLQALSKMAGETIIEAAGLQKGAKLNRQEKRMVDTLLSPLVDSRTQSVAAGVKGDAWALGVTGFNLLYGKESLVDSPFNSDVEQGIRSFGQNPDNRAISQEGGFAKPSGFGAEDDLINQLMHPDPDQRLSAQQALDHRAFDMPGVGSQQARDLIVAMMKGDAEGMARASGALAPPPPSPNQSRPLPSTPQNG